jgi:hypothetical protein
MNFSHHEPMDPYMDEGQSKKRVEACGQTFPAHDQSAVLPLEPGKRALGLVARDVRLHRASARAVWRASCTGTTACQ